MAQRLSAVSSYYNYLKRPGPDGQPLHDHNSVDGVERADLEVSPYERAKKISVEDFKKILEAIDTNTARGARDRAAFLFYVLCGRRRREVVDLHGRDIRIDGSKVSYRARLKGGRAKWKELPPPVWAAIVHYLEVSGRERRWSLGHAQGFGYRLRNQRWVDQPRQFYPMDAISVVVF